MSRMGAMSSMGTMTSRVAGRIASSHDTANLQDARKEHLWQS